MAKHKEEFDVKNRRFDKNDWGIIQAHVKKEFDTRDKSSYRVRAKSRWAEVDRQVALEPMKVKSLSGKDDEVQWHSAIELGELSKASEVYSADFNRITFPPQWFKPHAEVEVDTQKEQDRADGALRALMTQQHKDFGFRKRVGSTVKEAFHHGCYGVEILWSTALKFSKGTGVESTSAPIWVAHSMWNTFPDPSPSVAHGGLFYDGSMIFRSYMPLSKVKAMAKGGSKAGWMNIAKIPKTQNKNKDVDTKDVELLTYYGDLDVARKDGDIFLPNSKVILANGVIIYWNPIDTNFPPVIYGAYENLDIRDPYGTSPIIKNSPMQKLASIMANKSVDVISTAAEPPIGYDGQDPKLIKSGGPDRSPGASNPMRGPSTNIKEFPVGDPNAPLLGLRMTLDQLQSGTGVDAPRTGGGQNTEKTAFEVKKTTQGGELRTVEFIAKFEREAILSFLYMQHELNKMSLKSYPFFNPDMDAPDFERLSKGDLPKNVHFEIVGSKGVLGEEERTERTAMVTDFWIKTSPGLIDEVFAAKQMYQDAGNKNPEAFLGIKSKDDETKLAVDQVKEEAQAQMEELQGMVQELQQKEQNNELEKQQLRIKITARDEKISIQDKQIQLEDKINQDLKILNQNELILDEIQDELKELEKLRKQSGTT